MRVIDLFFLIWLTALTSCVWVLFEHVIKAEANSLVSLSQIQELTLRVNIKEFKK